ncbi:MAG: aldehyde-activating protein [Caulobacteraceae bacterium]|nr:aldehyde-activating protein [Caulobacteraceae bacterium]
MIYRGACHCGAVHAEYETDQPVRLRQDGCGFCSSRGVKSASDPEGRLQLTASKRLTRYRFGHKTADFLICPACGTYVATHMESPNLPATLTLLEGETTEERLQRRISRWTPMTLTEAAS